uniref:Pre-mRNA 3'-end-processing factor FIP1 n=1 Tax=Rhabditophanes sp. KR3021 TaxID=114890 RepID=A0AC35TM07_9BILA
MEEQKFNDYRDLPVDEDFNPFEDEYPMEAGQDAFVQPVPVLNREAEDDDDDDLDLQQQNTTAGETQGSEGKEDQFDSEKDKENEDADSDDESEDGIVVKVGVINTTIVKPKPAVGKINIDGVSTINGENIFDLDLNSLEDKPWCKPGADLTDFFNYGFVEDTWNTFCERQRKLRGEFGGNQVQINQSLFSQMSTAPISVIPSALSTNTNGRQLVNLVGSENPHNNSSQNNRLILTTNLTTNLNSSSNQQQSSFVADNSDSPQVQRIDFSKPPPRFDGPPPSMIKREAADFDSTNEDSEDVDQNAGLGRTFMPTNNMVGFNPLLPPPGMSVPFGSNIMPPGLGNFMPPAFRSQPQPPFNRTLIPPRQQSFSGNSFERNFENDTRNSSPRHEEDRRRSSRSPSKRRRDDRDRDRDRKREVESDRRRDKDSDRYRESSRRGDRNERSERSERSDRNERSERTDRSERSEKDLRDRRVRDDRDRDRDKSRKKDKSAEEEEREKRKRRHHRDEDSDKKDRKRKREAEVKTEFSEN